MKKLKELVIIKEGIEKELESALNNTGILYKLQQEIIEFFCEKLVKELENNLDYEISIDDILERDPGLENMANIVDNIVWAGFSMPGFKHRLKEYVQLMEQ